LTRGGDHRSPFFIKNPIKTPVWFAVREFFLKMLECFRRRDILYLVRKKVVKYSGIVEEIVPMVSETEAPYLIERVRHGLAMGEFHALQEQLGVSEERLGALLGMSRATLHRRKKSGLMDRAESDRLVRYARLFARASEALGGHAGARSWLVEPARAFHGECPLDYADTEIGAREVEALLGRLEHGVFS
jgi:putative toxin-antitoxin system antitoxin component (TIGR02293 family)